MQQTAGMEQDRADADVGKAVEAEIAASAQDAERTPKKRFIGRRVTAGKNEKDNSVNGTIEDSSAIQGMFPEWKDNFLWPIVSLTLVSVEHKTNRPCLEPSPTRNIE